VASNSLGGDREKGHSNFVALAQPLADQGQKPETDDMKLQNFKVLIFKHQEKNIQFCSVPLSEPQPCCSQEEIFEKSVTYRDKLREHRFRTFDELAFEPPRIDYRQRWNSRFSPLLMCPRNLGLDGSLMTLIGSKYSECF